MIPYQRFDFESIAAISRSRYDRLSLPFVHYRPVKAIMLDDRFVLVEEQGLWDTLNKVPIATVQPMGVRFSRGARRAHIEITPFISPYRLKVVSGIWAIETTDRILIHRDEIITRELYQLTPDIIRGHLDAINGLEEYVGGLDLNKELSDHSFDLCAQCNARQANHLDFHICRGEIGARLLSELTGMTRDGQLTEDKPVVKARLLDLLKLTRGSVVGAMRLALDVNQESEQYFITTCPWGHPGGLRW